MAFKAHLKHALLFNAKLIIPDSYAINNFNFRKALREDSDFQALVSDQMLSVAVRRDPTSESCLSLLAVRDALLQQGRHPKEFSDEEYTSNAELVLLETNVPLIPYSLDAVAQRYAEKTLEIFQSAFASRFLENEALTKLIAQLASDEYQTSRSLGRSFFYYNLQSPLERMGHIHWMEYRDKILDLANAPYFTALPSLLQAEPVYATEHAGAFDIISGRSQHRSEQVAHLSFATSLGLLSFVQGVSLLSRDSILHLLDSDEAKHFFHALTYSHNEDIDLQSVQEAIQAYQLRIDSEIIKYHKNHIGASSDGNKKSIAISYTDVLDQASDAVTYLSIFLSALSPVLTPLSLIFTKPLRSGIEKILAKTTHLESKEQQITHTLRGEFAQMMHARDRLIEEFRQEREGESSLTRINAETFFERSDKETIYKHVI